ncbi:metal-sulfur cluster assembly factor [Egicoccus sp. AB-alg2]|uniref:metal-sulfur cluster assembly factor n=1 Tax=Egicoccus sp. AB-alg2 TaxID=3242693 RepID=UPI00359E39C4
MASVPEAIVESLRGVVDPCCRDRGISVVDMGLVDDVRVDGQGNADVEIVLTSGWCPFQVDLLDEITAAVRTVPGVADAAVRITLDTAWSGDRLSPAARAALRFLPEPVEVGDRDAFLAATNSEPGADHDR